MAWEPCDETPATGFVPATAAVESPFEAGVQEAPVTPWRDPTPRPTIDDPGDIEVEIGTTTPVVITGDNFTEGMEVVVVPPDGAPADAVTITNVVVVSPTEVTFDVTVAVDAPGGSYGVFFVNPNGESPTGFIITVTEVPSPVTFLSDTFAGGPAALGGHVAEIGGAWSLVFPAGDDEAIVEGGRVHAVDDSLAEEGAGGGYESAALSPSPNVRLRITLRRDAGDVGLEAYASILQVVGRYSLAGGYRLQIQCIDAFPDDIEVALTDGLGNGPTTSYPLGENETVVLDLILDGTNLSVEANNVEILAWVDATFDEGSGVQLALIAASTTELSVLSVLDIEGVTL